RLSLETGTSDAFKSARVLYQSMGFRPCEAFGEYENTEDNICMTKYFSNLTQQDTLGVGSKLNSAKWTRE
ncbi:MAG: hypothetical protein ACKOFJ_05430, partial [Actinomycetota bacterium]